MICYQNQMGTNVDIQINLQFGIFSQMSNHYGSLSINLSDIISLNSERFLQNYYGQWRDYILILIVM